MYEMKRKVTYSQVGSDLKIDMAMLVHYFQDCAIFQSESIHKGFGEMERTHTTWYLSGWQIEVIRYPEFKEEITVRTWPHSFKGLYGYRNFDILDEKGNQIVQANSIWIFMDLEKMKPAKVTPEGIAGYDTEPAIDMEYAPRKIQIMDSAYRKEDVDDTPVIVKRSFLDSNLHVNNGRYVTEAMDYLQDFAAIKSMRVDYRKAAALGDRMYPAIYEQDNCCQVVFSDEQGNPFVIVEVLW